MVGINLEKESIKFLVGDAHGLLVTFLDLFSAQDSVTIGVQGLEGGSEILLLLFGSEVVGQEVVESSLQLGSVLSNGLDDVVDCGLTWKLRKF